MIAPGRRTLAWNKVRSELKVEFEKWGITSCELTTPHNCWGDTWLSFAHKDKRRWLDKDELYHVILSCTPGHSEIEKWPRAKMRSYVEEVARGRFKRLKAQGVDINPKFEF